MAATYGPPVGSLPLPPRPGTYALFLQLDRSLWQRVGRLGDFAFSPGIYAYTGSARGAGGLAARLHRHLYHPAPPHWHIDHLRAVARPTLVWWAEGEERRECIWAQAMARMEGASLPVPRFGASDCRCPAHLIHFPEPPDRERFERAVGEAVEALQLHFQRG